MYVFFIFGIFVCFYKNSQVLIASFVAKRTNWHPTWLNFVAAGVTAYVQLQKVFTLFCLR